jgi:endonuclease/exonuclease/phosphatase family metal-dependent hydrolase
MTGKAKRLLVCNTHLDHQGSASRKKSVEVILEKMKTMQKAWDADAVVLTGDFNSTTKQEAYLGMVKEGWMKDARECVAQEGRYGEEVTYTGFGRGEGRTRIDYVWVGPEEEVGKRVEVLGYAVMPNVFDDGVYLSDHRAVVADVVVR